MLKYVKRTMKYPNDRLRVREKNHFLKCEPILAVTFVTFVTRSEVLDNQRSLQNVARYIVLQNRPNVTKNAHFQVKTGTKATLLV